MNNPCGIILLAAGASSRLGKPKQLLVYNQSTLLQHSINIALASVAEYVVLVLGAAADIIQPARAHQKLSIVKNVDWQEGIASSIRCGLTHLCTIAPAVQHAVFMACDQPFISTALLNNLVTLQRQSGSALVASKYAETTGIPAVFDKILFPDLLQLKGDAGAKKLILQQADKITVPFPKGNIDIDTAADYTSLQKMKDG